MGQWSAGKLKTKTAESIAKKEGGDELIKSNYIPRIEEYVPPPPPKE